MPGSFIEVVVRTEPSLFDELIALLHAAGFQGFWEEDRTVRAYIAEDLWSAALSDSLHSLLSSLAHAHSLPPIDVTIGSLQDRNWNEAWKATIVPVRVTGKIVIAPTWHPLHPEPGDIVLTIDPKMSFGTGYHESTRLMLRLLEKEIRTGMRMLDVGTGTGVLAIAAIKLGAAGAIGIDTDEWSFTNASENIRLNHVADRCLVRRGDIDSVGETGFDLIAANIQRNVIEPMIPALVDRLAPAGCLLLSGLLLGERDAIAQRLSAARLGIFTEERENEWIALGARPLSAQRTNTRI
jgi:ribosomal protein L11 methyltransferase